MAIRRQRRRNSAPRYQGARPGHSRREKIDALKRWLFVIMVVAALLVAVGFLAFRSSNGISLFENVVGTVFRPVQSGFNAAADWVKDFVTNWRDYGELRKQYDELEMENESLSMKLTGIEEMEMENDRLKALLDAKDAYEELDPIYAEVIARDPGQWFDTFSINRGTSNGVKEGMAVMTGDGLVGHVYEAGLTYAKVRTIIDSRSAVACLVQRTRDNGVMRGEVTANSEYAECYVYYLPNVNNIVPGDVIITSGMDSLYPKGLTIGEVIAVSQEVSADGSYVIASPYVDFRHVEEVLVLRTVVETAESLPVVATPTPIPGVTPAPTQIPVNDDGSTVAPDDGNWNYPTIAPTPAPTINPEATKIEILPEDGWAE